MLKVLEAEEVTVTLKHSMKGLEMIHHHVLESGCWAEFFIPPEEVPACAMRKTSTLERPALGTPFQRQPQMPHIL